VVRSGEISSQEIVNDKISDEVADGYKTTIYANDCKSNGKLRRRFPVAAKMAGCVWGFMESASSPEE
jgi:hypothetical protein